jgi:TonB-dependent receptor
MNKINRLFRPSLAASIAFQIASSTTFAQEASSAEASTPIEEVIVVGIRSSLNSAADIKKNASTIVDSIVAEDIGKFPDENVAESLQRVPGVSIDRGTVGGEGSSISLRGLGPDFSRVFINGRTVTATSASRQVNFSDLPSEMVARLDVYKTPMASLIEGSIGGSVEIKTASPFSGQGGFKASGSLQGVNSTLADEWNPRISGQISNTFADDTIGVLLGIQYQDRTTRQDTFDIPGWECVDATLEATCDPNASLDDKYFRPRFSRQFLRLLDSKRMGANTAIHWVPSDTVKIEFDTFYSTRDDYLEDFTNIIGTASAFSDIVTGSEVINENNTVIAFDTTSADMRTNHRPISSEQESMVLGLNGEFIAGPWIHNLDLAYSKSSTDSSFKQAQLFREVDGRWDYRTSSGIPTVEIDGFTDDPTSTDGWLINNARNELTFIDQEETNFRYDGTLELNGFVESVQVGIRLTRGELGQLNVGYLKNIRPYITVEDFEADNGIAPGSTISTITNLAGVSNYGTDLPNGSIFQNWALGIVPVMVSTILPDDPFDNEIANNTYTINEDTNAAYAQVNFGNNDNFSGNFGVRYVQTKLATTGGGGGPQANDYSDLLPSLNIRYDLKPEELLLRFGLSKAMSRASYSQLNPGITVNTTTQSGSAGNPLLNPFRADQLDASVEWYFGGAGDMLSLSYFYKDIDSFIQTETIFGTVDPALLGGTDPSVIYAVSTPTNGEGATVSGFELSYQQAFINLPAPFDGLGTVASYTRLSDDAKQTNSITGVEVGLQGLSENSYNFTMYYEKYGFSARLAYNWRDEFLTAAQGVGGTPEFANEYGQVDAQISYELTDNITISLDAKNLNDEVYRTYEFVDERMRTYNSYGKRFFVGLRAKL